MDTARRRVVQTLVYLFLLSETEVVEFQDIMNAALAAAISIILFTFDMQFE
jgi:hypothetical protein